MILLFAKVSRCTGSGVVGEMHRHSFVSQAPKMDRQIDEARHSRHYRSFLRVLYAYPRMNGPDLPPRIQAIWKECDRFYERCIAFLARRLFRPCRIS